LLAAPDSISIEEFRQCFQQWEWCWDHHIPSPGEYYEGDYSFILVQKFEINFLTIPGIFRSPLIYVILAVRSIII